MARSVDPERHLARRLQIIDAGLTCFARLGYAGASTSAICREAGIGSGTFFHYFPTKQQLLLAILELGTAETQEWFAARGDDEDPRAVIDAYVDHTADELAEPRIAGFVRAVGAVLGEPEVEAALQHDTRTLQEGLVPWVRRAQAAGQVRVDLTADDLTSWVLLVMDGFLARVAEGDAFTVTGQRPMLQDTVSRLLAP